MTGCLAPGLAENAGEPSSDAVLVPRLHQPTLDKAIRSEEWANAHVIESHFVVDDGSNVSGSYPFTLLIGGDEERLSIAAKIPHLVPQQVKKPLFLMPDYLVVYLTGAKGPLQGPSDMLSMSNAADFGGDLGDGYWQAGAWRLQNDHAKGDFNDGRPTEGRWARAGLENGSAIWEATIYRSSELVDVDGFQAKGSVEFRMLVRFCRPEWPDSDPRTETRFDAHCDAYPGDGPTSGSEFDPSTWLRFRFDY